MPRCDLCGLPMPEGEEMFRYHGHSGPCPKPPFPNKEGWYWAKWLRPSSSTHEKEEMSFPLDWEIVEVWMNHFRDDPHEKFAVSVPGVRESQWPEDFKWGERIPDRA